MATGNQKDRQSYLAALCCAIPYHFVERVLADPTEESLGTQRINGSVLVIDLVGFTSVCEKLASRGPSGLAELSALLDRFFQWLELEAIFPYDGYIVQFAGDAVAVVFHGPGHARRCAACALTIRQHMLSGSREKLLGKHSDELLVRMGISLGDLRLNVLGDISRRFSLFTGEPAHRAIRLQKRAEPGEILSDVALSDQLGEDLDFAQLEAGLISPRDLRNWPERVAYPPLGRRIETGVEEKIALLEPFVPHPLAMRMRTSLTGWRLQGEIRRATVVFADYLGFAETSENLPLARNVARSAMRAFRKYDGVVVNLAASDQGQRALILFGLDKPSENDSERALLASLEAVRRLKAFSSPQGMQLVIRIAVHSGDVYVGSVGSHLKHDLTAVGDAVNLAARMLDHTEPFGILATRQALEGIGQEFKTTPLPPVQARGRVGQQEVVRVQGTVEARAHYFQRRRRPRPLSGRNKEMDRLFELVSSALQGRARAVGISGEAGTGKSALLAMALNAWAEGGGLGMVGYCRFATRSSPLAPLVDMFSAYFGFRDDDSEERRADLIRTGLQEMNLGRGLEDMLTLFQPVKRPDGLMEAIVDLAESHKQESVLDCITRFVDQRIHQDRICYVMEDLHLADTLTLAAIRRVLNLPRNSAHLFIATYRPDQLPEDFSGLFDEEIVVGNLNRQDAARLVCRELQASHVDPELADFLWQRTRGNPQHHLQMIAFLAERLLICVENDTVKSLPPGVRHLDDVIPAEWAHVALARMEGMGELERRVLKAASVIGINFEFEMLQLVLSPDLDQDMLECALQILDYQQAITCEDPIARYYRFKDEVTRAAAYSMIPESDRRDWHRRVADALENTGGHASHETAVALVHHRERAAQYDRAIRWCEQVIQSAARARLNREACHFADRWQTISEHLPEELKPGRQRSSKVALARLLSTSRLGDSRQTFGLARTLVQQYHDALDRPSRQLVNLTLAESQMHLGQLNEALARLNKCFRSSSSPGELRIDAALLTCRILGLKGELAPAAEWLGEAEALLGNDAERRLRHQLQVIDLRLLQADFDSAREGIDWLSGFIQPDLQSCQADVLRASGKRGLLVDSFEAAQNGLGKALGLDRRAGNRAGELEDLLLLGQAYLWDAQPDSAREHLENAQRIASDTGNQIGAARASIHLGAALAQTGDPDKGRRMCLEGRNLAERFGLAWVVTAADLHLLTIGMDRDDLEEREIEANRIQALSPVPLSPLVKRILQEAVCPPA